MKVFIVYIHLLAVCISIGSLLLKDFELMRKRGETLFGEEVKYLQKTAKVMIYALFVLWVTGISLVAIGYIDNPATYFTNGKILAKITVVFLLTINGCFLHWYSFPRITSRSGLFGLSWNEQVLVGLTGIISTVSWLYAAYLGIARHWNFTVHYSFIMTVYFLMIAVGFIFLCEFLYLFGQRVRNFRK